MEEISKLKESLDINLDFFDVNYQDETRFRSVKIHCDPDDDVIETDTGFDMDVVEADWLKNGVCLSDEDIREIYIQEGVTWSAYQKKVKECEDKLPKPPLSSEEKLLASIFNDEEKIAISEKFEKENDRKLDEIYADKPRLSEESRKRVVEGCMDLVFGMVRGYYRIFGTRVPMEDLYYNCLEALNNSAKYCLHYKTKDCFRAYAAKGMRRQIVSYIARRERIAWRNANYLVTMLETGNKKDYFDYYHVGYTEEIKLERRSIVAELRPRESINYLLRNRSYVVDYVREIAREITLKDLSIDCMDVLDSLTSLEEYVIRKRFEQQYTEKEIAELLHIDIREVREIKKRALHKLRDSHVFDKYRGEINAYRRRK